MADFQFLEEIVERVRAAIYARMKEGSPQDGDDFMDPHIVKGSDDYARAALSVLSPEVGRLREGWTLVPNLGTSVTADHPISCANPDPVFEVEAAKCSGRKWYVRGANTIWFNVNMIKPPALATAGQQQEDKTCA